jgi:hypothetical protein
MAQIETFDERQTHESCLPIQFRNIDLCFLNQIFDKNNLNKGLKVENSARENGGAQEC